MTATDELLARLKAAAREHKGARLNAHEAALACALLVGEPLPTVIERPWRDPTDPYTAEAVAFDDPVERAAIALHLLDFHVPETALPRFTRDEDMVRQSWTSSHPDNDFAFKRRHVMRRRVDVILRAYRGVLG